MFSICLLNIDSNVGIPYIPLKSNVDSRRSESNSSNRV